MSWLLLTFGVRLYDVFVGLSASETLHGALYNSTTTTTTTTTTII